MIGGVFGAAGSHNDVGVLNLSRLIQYLEQLLFPDFAMAGGILPALFGDSIFQNVNHSTIIARYNLNLFAQQEQDFIRRLNFHLSGVRQSIEHMYGQLFNFFRLLKQPCQFVLLHDAELAYRTAVSCFFILNCYTCFNGSPCNSMFSKFPPTLQEYLPLEEEIIQYRRNDNIIYDFYQFN
jgi:hypothetical protein